MTFIYGDKDWMLNIDKEAPARAVERLEKSAPRASPRSAPLDREIIMLQNAGHYVFIDQPASAGPPDHRPRSDLQQTELVRIWGSVWSHKADRQLVPLLVRLFMLDHSCLKGMPWQREFAVFTANGLRPCLPPRRAHNRAMKLCACCVACAGQVQQYHGVDLCRTRLNLSAGPGGAAPQPYLNGPLATGHCCL